MCAEANPRSEVAIHATAVAIVGCAIVIRGPSGSGKSALAAALVGASTAAKPIELVGDDRVILVHRDGALTTRPHPRIAGFIERRGLGLVAMPFRAEALLVGVVELDDATTKQTELQNLPTLSLVHVSQTVARRNAVLRWFDGLELPDGLQRFGSLAAAYRSQFAEKWP